MDKIRLPDPRGTVFLDGEYRGRLIRHELHLGEPVRDTRGNFVHAPDGSLVRDGAPEQRLWFRRLGSCALPTEPCEIAVRLWVEEFASQGVAREEPDGTVMVICAPMKKRAPLLTDPQWEPLGVTAPAAADAP